MARLPIVSRTSGDVHNRKDSALALPDPISITIGGSAKTLPRVNTGNKSSDYLAADSLVALKAATTNGKTRNTRVISLKQTKMSADPYKPAEFVKDSLIVNLTTNEPLTAFDLTERVAAVKSLCAMIQASSYAILTKWLAGEN